jgi:hypothetical protein
MRFQMERRIAGIVRWLERCLKACNTGALESALMDVECARVDLESLRNEVWAELERKNAGKSRMGVLAGTFRVASVAFMVVLATATPLARFQEVRPHPEPAVSLEWVTPDEKALLSSLRRHLSESNSFAAVPEPEEKADAPATAKTTKAKPPVAMRSEKRSPRSEMNAKPDRIMNEKSGTSAGEMTNVPYDRIMMLMQTGEKALKNERPVITIERGETE